MLGGSVTEHVGERGPGKLRVEGAVAVQEVTHARLVEDGRLEVLAEQLDDGVVVGRARSGRLARGLDEALLAPSLDDVPQPVLYQNSIGYVRLPNIGHAS